jgi:hypothetical protein
VASTSNAGSTAGLSHFRFCGRVFPTILKASLRVPGTRWTLPEHNIDISLSLELNEGDLAVNCYVKDYSEEIHFPMIMRAHDFARAAVDTLAFSTGAALTVIFETVTLPDGRIEALAIQEKDLAALSTAAHPLGKDPHGDNFDAFSEIMQMVLAEPPLFRAMHDQIQSITVMHAAQTACLRCVETLRNYMSPDMEDRAKQWRALGDALRVEESYIQPLRDLSTGPRHGDPIHIPGPEIKDAQKRAWTIMNRYLEFRRLGAKDPLPTNRFPVLT